MRTFVCVSVALGLALLAAGPARADDQAELKAVIDKAIKAHGGLDKLKKHQGATMKLKGKVHVMGMTLEYAGDMAYMSPDKFKFAFETEVMGMKFQQTQVLNGDKGWLWNSIENKTTEMDKDTLAEGKEEIYVNSVESLEPLVEKGFKFSSLGEQKVGDRPAIGIRVSHDGHRDVSLFFDKESHLLIKSEHQAKDMMAGGQEYRKETFHQDYKEHEGIKYAGKIVVKKDGEAFVDGEISEFKLHEKLDDSVFSKP